jgi:hypothetical protein
LKRHVFTCIKYTILIFIILSTSFALYVHYKGSSFDPVEEIQKLKNENRRDEALDLSALYLEKETGDARKIKELQKNLEYTPIEKVKSFTWNGIVKGEVYDTYSGMGAISADLSIWGDIRDLGIQSWLFITDDPDFDKLVLILSAAGIGLAGTSFVNGAASLAKNILKYLKRFPHIKRGEVLKKFLTGKLSIQEFKQIWNLLKKTTGVFPGPQIVYPRLKM